MLTESYSSYLVEFTSPLSRLSEEPTLYDITPPKERISKVLEKGAITLVWKEGNKWVRFSFCCFIVIKKDSVAFSLAY